MGKRIKLGVSNTHGLEMVGKRQDPTTQKTGAESKREAEIPALLPAIGL
jgi:hypothetical protein